MDQTTNTFPMPVRFQDFLKQLVPANDANLAILNGICSCKSNNEYKDLLLEQSELMKVLLDIGNQIQNGEMEPEMEAVKATI